MLVIDCIFNYCMNSFNLRLRKMQSSIVLLLLIAVLSCSFSRTYGLDFFLKRYGRRVEPNSVIDISRVGREYRSYYYYYTSYTNEGPLVCRTDDTHCCRDVDDPIDNEQNGEWFFPNGQVVGSTEGSPWYVTRGRQELSLHRYTSSQSPTGVYCCDIQSVNASGNITAGYVSPTNYSYINSSTTDCVGLYTYSQLRLCRDISVSNGWVTYDSPYIPGRVATVSCHSGFGLVGNRHLTCTYRGWSSSQPRCVYNCGPLSNPKNGKVDTSSGTYAGSTATYSCDKGYQLIGPATRSCQRIYRPYYSSSRYSWTNSAPYCADNVKIQLKFSPSTNCLEWTSSTASRIEESLRRTILQVMTGFGRGVSGSSNVSLSNIEPGVFSCRSSQTETTYRTTIVGLEDVSAHSLARVIQRWTSSAPSIKLQWYVGNIDKQCPVAIDSEFEPECGSRLDECIEYCYAAAGLKFDQ